VKSETKFSRKNRWAAAIVAIMAVLAVVIGPLCAPICSATFCAVGAPQSAEDEGCHGSRAQHSDGAKGSLAAVKTCRAGINVVILSNPEEKRPFLQATRDAPVALDFGVDSSELDGLNIASRARWRDRSSPDLQSELSLQTIILRI
jgi:hypothetical protein